MTTALLMLLPRHFLKPCSMPAGHGQNHIIKLLCQFLRQLFICCGVTRFVSSVPTASDTSLMIFVFDQRLLYPAPTSLYYIHKIIYNAVFNSHHNIKISKTNIGINQNNFISKGARPQPRFAATVVFPTPPFLMSQQSLHS